ncbi:HD domain-containing protein [Pyrobaculum sp.]|uniref:HD domain-containing protein n=1 Tax=Pyrobaculum sp. TaxID=2004705 RepID=UPI003D10E6EB
MSDALSVVDTLCKTPRVGWLQRGVPDAESVCEHIMLVTLLAGEIAAHLNAEGAEVDLAKVLAVAAVHDLAESILGHPGREVRDRLRWEELEEEVIKREFPHLAELFRWYRYETNFVGRIVAFADKLATLIRACRYKKLGFDTDDLIKNLYGKLSKYDDLAHILDLYLARYCPGAGL